MGGAPRGLLPAQVLCRPACHLAPPRGPPGPPNRSDTWLWWKAVHIDPQQFGPHLPADLVCQKPPLAECSCPEALHIHGVSQEGLVDQHLLLLLL